MARVPWAWLPTEWVHKKMAKIAFDRLAVLMCEIPQVDWYIMFSSLTHQGGMGRRPMQVVKPSQTFPIISMRDLHICSGAFAQEAKKHRHVKCVVRSTTGRWTWLLDTVGRATGVDTPVHEMLPSTVRILTMTHVFSEHLLFFA